MGYRLHYAVHHNPQFEGGYFNRDIEKWEELFKDKFSENGWKSETEDIYDVERADIEAYIAELKELDGEAFNEYFPEDGTGIGVTGFTNNQIIDILEEILLSEDDTIRLSVSNVKEEHGKLAMQVIADHPLYASTCGITYDEAIAIAKVFISDGNFQGYIDEMERFEELTPEEMKKELEEIK